MVNCLPEAAITQLSAIIWMISVGIVQRVPRFQFNRQ